MPTFNPPKCSKPEPQDPCAPQLPDPVVTTCWNIGDLLCPPDMVGVQYAVENIGGVATYSPIEPFELTGTEIAQEICNDPAALQVIIDKVDTDTIGVFDTGEVTGDGTAASPWVINHPTDLFGPSADAGNILTAGSEGLAFLDAAAVNAVVEHTPSSVANNTDGTYTHSDGEGNDEVITVVSGDTGNLITVGADNGAYIDAAAINGAIDCDTVLGCVNVAGDIAGTGTEADPFTVTIPESTVAANAPITGDGSAANPLNIDFSALDAADLSALVAAICANNAAQTALAGCLQSLIDTDTFGTIAMTAPGVFTWTSADGASTETWNADSYGELVANGDGSYTWTSADGATSFTIPAPAVSTLTDNGDGTYTHTDGAGGAPVTFGSATSAITDNGDGTFTHNAGDGSADTVVDMGVMSVADGGSNLVDNTDPDNPVINNLRNCLDVVIDVTDAAIGFIVAPISNLAPLILNRIQANSRALQYRFKDGTICYSATEHRNLFVGFGSPLSDIEVGTPAGTVLAVSQTRPIHIFPCDDMTSQAIGYHSYGLDQVEGTAQVEFQYSIDGGATWTAAGTGGNDDIGVPNNGPTTAQEIPYTEHFGVPATPAGTTIQYRIVLVTNNLTSGIITVNAPSGYINTLVELYCCT